MSLDTDILAIPGLLAFWKLSDITGTTAPDSGPNNLPLTVTNPVVGSPLTNMPGSASLRGNGTSTYAGTAATLAGNPLRLAANAPFTFAAFVNVQGLPASGQRGILTRVGTGQLRVTTGQYVQEIVPGISQGGTYQYPIGEAILLALAFDGIEYTVTMNGITAARNPVPAGPADTSDVWELLTVGQGGGAAAQADIERAFVVGRGMSPGELRSIYEAGAVTPYTFGSSLVDGQSAAIPAATSPIIGRCNECTGQMRAGDAQVADVVGRRHVACYTARARSSPQVVPSSSMSDRQIGESAARLLTDLILDNARRPTALQDYYFDNNLWTVPGNTTMQEIMGAAAGAAALYRLTRGKQQSWLRRIAIGTVEQAIATQTANLAGNPSLGCYGEIGKPMTQIGGPYLLETYLWLMASGALPADKAAVWRNSFLAAGSWWRATGERTFYVNGNVECDEALLVWLIYKATGDTTYLDDYNAQVVRMANPPLGTGNATGHGWVQSVVGAAVDGSDSQGYFTEKGPTGPPGYDPVYTQVQLGTLTRLHHWNNDARLVPYINAMMNKLLTTVNTTGSPITVSGQTVGPWVLDARNGTRNNRLEPFKIETMYYLKRNPSLRSTNPLTATWPAAHWAVMEPDERANRNIRGVRMRGWGEYLAPWLRSSPLWPGDA